MRYASALNADKEFGFTLSLKNPSGTALSGSYKATISNDDGSLVREMTVRDGNRFTLKGGQTILVEEVPVGIIATVKEDEVPAFALVQASSTMSGTVQLKQTLRLNAVNEYQATGSVVLHARKVSDGFGLKEDQFSFNLLDKEKKARLQTKKNDRDGRVDFSPLSFTAKDIGKRFEYQIEEIDLRPNAVDEKDIKDKAEIIDWWTDPSDINPNPKKYANVLYDRHMVDVTVDVTDNGDGTLNVIATYFDPDGGATFTNVVTPKGDTGREPKNTFRVAAPEGFIKGVTKQ